LYDDGGSHKKIKFKVKIKIKLLEHAMKVIECMFERKIQRESKD